MQGHTSCLLGCTRRRGHDQVLRRCPMPHENSSRFDQFWMADPLNILIQSVLTKPFNLEDAEVDVATGQVLQYIEFLGRSKTLEEAWQQRSFYELLVDNNASEENALRSSHEL